VSLALLFASSIDNTKRETVHFWTAKLKKKKEKKKETVQSQKKKKKKKPFFLTTFGYSISLGHSGVSSLGD
jgi:hypothetical protein